MARRGIRDVERDLATAEKRRRVLSDDIHEAISQVVELSRARDELTDTILDLYDEKRALGVAVAR